MILIADSGSTKTDWRLISEKEEVKSVSTPESILFIKRKKRLKTKFPHFVSRINGIFC